MGLTEMGQRAAPDGAVHYRVDASGRRVGVLPATCKAGVHALHISGYTATESGGVLRLTCTACAKVPDPDHTWRLTTSGGATDRAELDDEPYRDLTPHLQWPPSVRAAHTPS